jgi:hypothetical protein
MTEPTATPVPAAATSARTWLTYSEAANTRIQRLSTDLLEDLTALSERFASRQGLDSVSAAHVDRAHQVLREGDYQRRVTRDFLLAFGVFGLGICFTLWFSIYTGQMALNWNSGIIATLTGVVGVGLAVFSAFRLK